MGQAREWYRWKRRESTELYLLWGLAALTYGGGDVITTIILVYAIPGLGEANPIVRWALVTVGPLGLVALKLAVFGIGISVTWSGLKRRDRLMYYAPPIGMTVVGLGVTAINLRLII